MQNVLFQFLLLQNPDSIGFVIRDEIITPKIILPIKVIQLLVVLRVKWLSKSSSSKHKPDYLLIRRKRLKSSASAQKTFSVGALRWQ